MNALLQHLLQWARRRGRIKGSNLYPVYVEKALFLGFKQRRSPIQGGVAFFIAFPFLRLLLQHPKSAFFAFFLVRLGYIAYLCRAFHIER